MAQTEKNYFTTLNSINVTDKTEKKNGLTYLSWAWAWGELKKIHPDATYTVYETPEGCFYFTDGRTCWVKTGVTVNGIEHIEYLPVMDYRNKSIPKDQVTSFDVNKTIQRSLTKAVARHGLGLYIYAGEDLPGTKEEEEEKEKERAFDKKAEQTAKQKINETKQKALLELCHHEDIDVDKLCKLYKVNSFGDMTEGMYSNIAQHMKEIKDACGKENKE